MMMTSQDMTYSGVYPRETQRLGPQAALSAVANPQTPHWARYSSQSERSETVCPQLAASAAAAALCMRSEPALNSMNMRSACRSVHFCVPLDGICHSFCGDRCLHSGVCTRVLARSPVTF